MGGMRGLGRLAIVFLSLSGSSRLDEVYSLRHEHKQKHVPLTGSGHQSPTDVSHRSLILLEQKSTSTEDDYQPQHEDWLCRISRGGGECGPRGYPGIRGSPTGVFCPDGHCCSKTACRNFSCGAWCESSWALCSSWMVYHETWSYGRCNCEQFGGKCDPNADCVHKKENEGGVYCRCRQGYYGDGKSCKLDACTSNPCHPGTCSRDGEGYNCTCPDTHNLIEEEGQKCVEKPDYCRGDPCGPSSIVEKCINRDEGYDCECKQGYGAKNGRCEQVDLCANDACGPPEGVHSCVTLREPTMHYQCTCQTGWDKTVAADGVSEYCEKNHCFDEPCGPSSIVRSCSNKKNGYSCLCEEGYEPGVVDGKEQCTKADACKSEPCGSAEKVKQCYSEGSTYKCVCQTGYTEVIREGRRRCEKGDPCILGMCGSPEAVDECQTDGSWYTCTCNSGYMQGEKDGMKTCISEEECVSNCGPVGAVKECTITDGSYKCSCNVGYVLKYRGSKRMCAEGSACDLNPCGTAEAVKSCTADGNNYDCICNTGFVKRSLPDGKPICADPNSCVGNPCGNPSGVESCIAQTSGYSCKCKTGYTLKTVATQQQCVPEAPESTGESGSESGETVREEGTTKQESSGMSTATIAGGVIGGLAILGVAVAGVTYMRKRNADDDDEDDEGAEGFLAQPGPGAPGGPAGLQQPYMQQMGMGHQAWASSPSNIRPPMGRGYGA
ncbi:micronemal protein 8 [Cystoisospora suis]|uniref:Micronemal protein 8 n=1 Tax=Cystoisospora suis TaxID=483139 RepID=A0A2C6L333_9APIC|nr:micronemal protein 8 [Cystoisospora suis]